MRLRTLGEPALLDDQGRAVFGPGKPLLILAYLEAHPDGASREFLASLAWGDSSDRKARGSLRQTLLRLRKELGTDALVGDARQVRLAAPLPSDRADFLAAIHDRDDPRACELYTGPYLPAIELDDLDDALDWQVEERLRLARLAQGAMLREARAALAAPDDRRAITLAERALRTDMSVAEPWVVLIEALGAAARFGERDDMLVRLELALRDGTIAAAERKDALAELEKHRDRRGAVFGAAQRTHAGEDFPLVGRQALLTRLLARLGGTNGERNGSRVVVLEGSAGLGKSRLLREVARRLAPGGTATVEVTAVGSEQATRWSLLTRLVRELTRQPGAAGMDAGSLRTFVSLDPTLAQRYPGAALSPRDGHSPERLTVSLVDLLGTLAVEGELALLVDDLHHADPDSIAVLTAAFARRETAGVSLLAATRPGHRQLPVEWPHWQVTPLDREAIEALLVEVVEGLEPGQLAEMAAALLLVSGGIPLYLRRATQLLSDDGHLRAGADGRLRVVDAAALLQALPNLSLHRDPSFPGDPIERRLLGYLTVAEEDVPLEELAAGLGLDHRSALDGILARLAVAGWVHHAPDSDVARIAHAVLRDQVMAVLGEATLARLREQRGRWLADHGTALVQIQAAVRLLHGAGRDREAFQAVRAWRRRAAIRGQVGAGLLAPSDSGALFRWRLAMATRPRAVVPAVAMLLLMVVVAGAWGWQSYMNAPVELVLGNNALIAPIDPAIGDSTRSPSNSQFPEFSIHDRAGRLTDALDGQALRVTLVHGADSMSMQPAPVVRNGRVRATSLQAWGGTGVNDSLVATFSVGRLRSRPVVLWHGWIHMRLVVNHGSLAGQAIDSVRPTIRVRPGERILGKVNLLYDTPSASATYALAESSTFGNITADTLTMATLHADATDALAEVIVDRMAPLTSGAYWLVWASGAENDARWILSRTNWKCGEPIWGDGNDLLDVPDSVLAQAWGGGWLPARRRLCDGPNRPEWQDLYREAPVAAVKVVVEE